jgi:hypothetical protein
MFKDDDEADDCNGGKGIELVEEISKLSFEFMAIEVDGKILLEVFSEYTGHDIF